MRKKLAIANGIATFQTSSQSNSLFCLLGLGFFCLLGLGFCASSFGGEVR